MPRLTIALFAMLICAATGAGAAATPREKTVDPLNRVRTLVAAAIAGDEARVQRVSAELKEQPKPPRGDRRVARDLNERGLALWQRQRFDEAAVLFRQAQGADASDAEIAELRQAQAI